MDKEIPLIGPDDKLSEDPEVAIAQIDRFLAGLEKHRDKFPDISDADILNLKMSRDQFDASVAVSKRADEVAAKAAADLEATERRLIALIGQEAFDKMKAEATKPKFPH